MFGSSIIEVAIGLALIFLLLSLVASAVREGIEGIIKARAVNLERGIRMLLDDHDGTQLTRTFYEHPLIDSLYAGDYVPMLRRFLGRQLPTYIPSSSFASAFLDLARRGPDVGPYGAMQTESLFSVSQLRTSVHRIPSARVQRALLTAIDDADGDLDRVRENLQAWFDSAMNSVSGAYRRRTQLYLFVIGLVLAIMLNVNTLTVADYLWRDDRARAALADRASRFAADTALQRRARDTVLTADEARRIAADLQSLNLPIGWDRRPPSPPSGAGWSVHFSYWTKQLFGILVTAFAITLGAPFWFDTLNKFVVIRSTVKPREKTAEEGSEDRSSTPPKSATMTQSALSSAGVAPATAAIPARSGGGGAGAPALPETVPPHEDQVWSDGVEEGII